MKEMTTMVIEKETGILIQSHELLAATTVATKVRSQIQEQTVWQLVRAEPKGHGAHIGRTHSLHINLKMVLSAQTLRRVVPQMLHMACIRYQP